MRHARQILSSHLLAAAACAGAEVAVAVTARVLHDGADAARRVLARRSRPLATADAPTGGSHHRV